MNMLNEFTKLYDTFDELMRFEASMNEFEYIYSKAYLYIKMGPEIYRNEDFFKMPDISWAPEYYPELKSGCEQILQGRGFLAENPIKNLDSLAFFYLFKLFHYDYEEKNSSFIEKDGVEYFLDRITFRHFVEDKSITYYNLIPTSIYGPGN